MHSLILSEYVVPLISSALLIATIACLKYSWLLPKPLSGIPHDSITSVLGHIPNVAYYIASGKGNNGDYFHQQPIKHGPISQVILGRTVIVILADKEELERLLLKTKSTEQSTWVIELFGTIMPYAQFALPTNDMWKRHRQLAGPSMSQRYLERMSTRMSTEANGLVRLWKRKMELVGDKAFDASRDLKLAMADATMSVTLGESAGYLDTAYASLLTSASCFGSDSNPMQMPQADPPPLYRAMEALLNSVSLLQFTPLPVRFTKIFTQTLNPSWRKSYRNVCEFLNQQIYEARARESQQSTFEQRGLATDADCVVDMIAQREAREGVEKLAMQEMRDELLNFLLGGQDNTPVVLSWVVKYLAVDTALQQQLHDEVCGLFGQDMDENEPLEPKILGDTTKVPLLEAVVAETLRCAWAAPNLVRELNRDEVILGHHIPKGTYLMYPAGPLSAQESDWGPDAKVWRPSRWLRADGSFDSNAGPSYHFGIGQRACFGQRMAVLLLKTFVATLSRSFRFRPVPDEVASFEMVVAANARPKYCYVSLERWPVQ